MSDDGGWGGGDLFLGLLIGALLMGDRDRASQTGHHHGQYWHTHVLPPGRHVHDGHPDGPIRVVPPTAEELAAEAQRRAEIQDGWGVVLGVLGTLALFAGEGRIGLTLLGAAAIVSNSMRSELRDLVIEAREGRAGARAQRSTTPAVAQPFVACGVDVGPDDAGRLRVRLHGWSQITAPTVDVEVTIWRRCARVGLLTVQLHDLVAGEARQVIRTGSVSYMGHDRVEISSSEAVR
jgi:hypothetical protein